MLRFDQYMEAKRPPQVLFRNVPRDQFLVALDKVEEDGLLTEPHPNNLARLMAIPNLAFEWDMNKRLPNYTVRRNAGRSWMTVHLFSKPALESLCGFIGVSFARHIRDDRLEGSEYFVLVTPDIAKQAAQAVLAQNPPIHDAQMPMTGQGPFAGKLRGDSRVRRSVISDINFPYAVIEALASVLPNDKSARGYVFHSAGLRLVLDQCLRLVGQKFGIPNLPMTRWDVTRPV